MKYEAKSTPTDKESCLGIVSQQFVQKVRSVIVWTIIESECNI